MAGFRIARMVDQRLLLVAVILKFAFLQMANGKCGNFTALGMEDGSISNADINATSEFDGHYKARFARLHETKEGGCWAPEKSENDPNPYLQVDFLEIKDIIGIYTQGCNDRPNYVKSYKVSYRNDEINFQPILDQNGHSKTFLGNTDQNTVVQQFWAGISARYIRVHPLTSTGKLGIRVEFIGCQPAIDECLSNPCQNDGTCQDGDASYNCTCASGYHGTNCEAAIDECLSNPCQNGGTYQDGDNSYECTCPSGYHGTNCEAECGNLMALGMEDDSISYRDIDATSEYSPEYKARFARLHETKLTGCWAPKSDAIDPNPYLEVDFLEIKGIIGIYTQGCQDKLYYVKSYNVSYSVDGINFQHILGQNENPKTFVGNADKNTVVQQFWASISARYIRVHPLKFYGKRGIRVEFIGCQPEINECESNPCQNNGACQDGNNAYVCACSAGYNGTHCETDIDECASNPCQNNGTCQDGANSFVCACQNGYTGIFCESDCLNPTPLGMESGAILDSQLSHSTRYSAEMESKHARLNSKEIHGDGGCWRPGNSDPSPWLQVDFLQQVTVPELKTQGRESRNHWVTNYTVSYSNDNDNFQDYKQNGMIKYFTGNSDSDSIVSRNCSPAIVARYIRVHPKTCHNYCAMRVEFVGCYEVAVSTKIGPTTSSVTTSNPSTTNATTSNVTTTAVTTTTVAPGATIAVDTDPVPIVGFALIPIPPKAFGELISVSWEITAGSNVSVMILYNDIQCCNSIIVGNTSGQCNCSVSDPGRFDPDGVVELRAVAVNIVSNSTDIVLIEVLKPIHGVSFSMLTSYSNFGSESEGRGSLRNIFPAEYPVKFNSSYLDGPTNVVEWTFTCAISGVIYKRNFFFDMEFSSITSQSCTIKLVLSNNISTANASGTIDLRESLIFDSMLNDGPVKENQTMIFTISLDKFGQDTCMTVDMGDNSSLLVFGVSSCPLNTDVSNINPNIVIEPRLIFSEKNAATEQIIIHHRYPELGTYVVKMNASNEVSMVTHETIAVVLGYICENPNVTISGLAPNTTNVLNAAQVYRSIPISLSIEKKLNCEKTQLTTISWIVLKFDDDPRILNTLPNMNIGNLRKSPYSTGISSTDLLIAARDLPYGFYEIAARLEMKDLPDVFGSDSMYIQIVQTPWIEAATTGGSFNTVPFGYVGSLNASSSFDPDYLGIDGISFAWYCRDVDDSEFLFSNLSHEVLISIPSANGTLSPLFDDAVGCFGTGRGRLDVTGSFLQLNTKTMSEDKTYAITLVVSKNNPEFGLRQDMSNIFFHVAKGLPPSLESSCSKNCRDKVMPDEKIIIKANCKALCYGKLDFGWSMYMYDDINMPEPYNLTDLNEITQEQLAAMALNPTNELDLAIKQDSLQPGGKYILAFRAIRPSRVYGEVRYTMFVNAGPVNGDCSISPLSGVAMQTNFTLTCEKWTDPEPPLTYEFSYGTQGSKAMFYHRTVASGQSISVTERLPVGDKLNDYTMNVTVDIKDSLGTRAVRNFLLKVVPPALDELDMNKLKDLVSGNISLALASSLGSLLNYIAQEPNVSHSQARSGDEIRLKILSSLSNAKATDVSSLIQLGDTILVLTEKQESLKVKDAALVVCESLTKSLKTLSDSDNGFQNIKKGAENLLGVVGGMTGGSNASSPAALKDKSVNHTKRSIHLIGNVQSILLDNLVTNEGPTTIVTDQLSLQVEKVSIIEFGSKPNVLKNSRFQPPSASALGLRDVVEDVNNTFLQLQPIDIKMASFNKNPFSWDNTSETITSNVIDIVLKSNMNISSSNFTEEVTIIVPRDPAQFPKPDRFFLKPRETNKTANTKEYLKYHCFTRRSNWTSMNFELHPEDLGIQFTVFMKKGRKPNIKNKDFEFSLELPDFSGCSVNNESVSNAQDKSKLAKSEELHIDPYKNCLKHPYAVFRSNTDFNGTGEYCFAVQSILNLTEGDTQSRRRRSVSCEVGKRRVRRSCVFILPAPPKPTAAQHKTILSADNLGFDGKFFFPNQTPNYNMTMFESSCVFWDVANETWAGQGCRVAVGTSKDKIVCLCIHLTSFGSDLLVAPNPIDFDAVFSNFGSLAENVAVLVLISTILCLYILGVLWARRADKRDLMMLGPTILSKPGGSHRYLVTVYTGKRWQAGTTARVVFKIVGDKNESLPVRLHDRHRPCFERGQDNAFVVSYPEGVGDVSYVQIWHDNSGLSPSWYLSRMSIKDLQTNKQWLFVCENWLAVESEDGKVCRVLHVANDEELTNFHHLFSARAIKGLVDDHLWFSIVSRPPNSNFTRIQRLSSALCLLCCTMITSAMFYNMGGEGPSPFAITIGSLIIDMKPFVIGLQSSIIIVPVNVVIVQIFRNLRPKEEKNSKPCSAEDEPGTESQEKKPPKGKLPHWFIYIAYALCYLASAASIFFTLLYSIMWGKETSTEWVIAMVTSFFQSVLLLQPIKVMFAAIVFALVTRKPCDIEEESDDVPALEETEKVEGKEDKPKKRRKKKRKFHKHLSPPSPAKLRKARVKRLKEIKMNEVLKEIGAFFFFLTLLMSVVQTHRDSNTFLLTKTLTETFEEVDAFAINLDAASDQDSLWMWARETLVPGLYATEWYNGKKVKKGYIANMEDYLVGIPRVRLVRVEEDSCRVSSYFEGMIPHCYNGYTLPDEELKDFDVGWEALASGTSRKRRSTPDAQTEYEWFELMSNVSQGERDETTIRRKRALDPIMSAGSGRNRRKKKRLLKSSSPKTYTIKDTAVLPNGKVLSCLERWRHQTLTELRGFPYWGTLALYSGSGYVANLGYDAENAYTVIADLHSNGWIDVQTRAVFVEFTVYNANTNLFGIISIFIEFPPSASAFTRVQYQAARFYLHLSSGEALAHILVMFFMAYFLYREAKLVRKQRWAYFKGFWNWIEAILVVCEFLTIILFLARLYEVDRNLLQLRENPNDYVGFQHAGNADGLMMSVLGALVFFYILRFLRLLRFNKNFLVLGRTISRISAPILSFCIPFTFAFIAFALFAFSVFGTELEDYASFMRTMVTQFSMALGDFDFEALVMVNPVLGPLYFFAFVGLNVMVLMNIFIAIINDSYAEVQEENQEVVNEYEVIDYVTGKLRDNLQAKFKKGRVVPIKKRKKKKKKKGKIPDSTRACCEDLDCCGARLDEMVDVIKENLDQEALVEERFWAVPEERRKDLFFRLLCIMESDKLECYTDESGSDCSEESDA